MMHLNQPCYMVGENLSYAIYFAKQYKEDSMLIYVELFSTSGKMEMQHIHRLYKESVQGQYTLPINLKEDMY